MYNAKELRDRLLDVVDINCIENAVISNTVKKIEDTPNKIRIDRVILKSEDCFQIASYIDKKVVHKNIKANTVEVLDFIIDTMQSNFKQCSIVANKNLTILMNKKREFNITGVKVNENNCAVGKSHNNNKNYILKDGVFVEWMYKLGLMDKDGNVINSRQKKFRQINKFLEMLKDVEKYLPENAEIIDMGCGKSYLTFAMYHYLNNIKQKNVKIKGFDLKKDVVEYCNKLAKDFNFEGLEFFNDDIANIENEDKNISMIITLHACDTATDIAIYHGIRWGCKVIMNVPCCQHELFGQIKNEDISPILDYGILKERFSALMTDGLRAKLLECMGYKTSVMEFIDMEHTPKNIMIRAIKDESCTVKSEIKKAEIDSVIDRFNVYPTLYKLLFDKK